MSEQDVRDLGAREQAEKIDADQAEYFAWCKRAEKSDIVTSEPWGNRRTDDVGYGYRS